MADPQGRPDNTSGTEPDDTLEDAPGAGPTPPAPPGPPTAEQAPPPADKPPADAPPEKAAKKAAKKAPAKAAKKAAPAKKAAAKKAPAKKAPAKKAPPAKKTEPSPPVETNGQFAAGAKAAAAQAKSTVDAAENPMDGESAPGGGFPVPLAVAIVVTLLALLLVRQLRRRGD